MDEIMVTTVVEKERKPTRTSGLPETSETSSMLFWDDGAVFFRTCRPADIPACAEMEAASYPSDEAASKATLQYRQRHAERFFRCCVRKTCNHANAINAVRNNSGSDDDTERVIGFVCGTKCRAFAAQSMQHHDPEGSILAVHSVVVAQPYRRRGMATKMLKEYIAHVQQTNDRECDIEAVVLLSKEHLLAFYVKCGFQVIRPSPIVHGQEQWYDLELTLPKPKRQCCYVVDAFASVAGTGNQAAVVPLPTTSENHNSDVVSARMQNVAQEFNLSETAFVWKLGREEVVHNDVAADINRNVVDTAADNGTTTITADVVTVATNEACFGIRYFTPTTEVPLCGHATLASAAVLYQTNAVSKTDSIVFQAKEDRLICCCSTSSTVRSGGTEVFDNQSIIKITMEFPTKPITKIACEEECHEILAMLQSAFPAIQSMGDVLYFGFSEGLGDLLIEITTDAFRNIGYEGLNVKALLNYQGYSRGVILCCKDGTDGAENTFCSRFFAPKAGIDEDPVTGSAHCALAPYFASQFQHDTVIGKQESRRGGVVECQVSRDGGSVKITGTAITTVSGNLWL